MTVFPPAFDYHRAAGVEDALDLLARYRDRDPQLLAGGHSLVPALKAGRDDPGVVIDLGGVDDLQGVTADDDGVTIGALTTYADALDATVLRERAPGVAEAIAAVGDRQIRNRGTVGGNLAAVEQGADLPPAVLAAGATVHVQGQDGERAVDADEFFRGGRETALGDGSILTAVRISAGEGERGTGGAYHKKTHPARGYAMVGVAARVRVEEDEVADGRVAVTGVTAGPTRLGAVEDALRGEPAGDVAVEAVAERAGDGLDATALHGDVHASGEFRARVLPTYVERALETAVDRAVADGTTGARGGDTPTGGGAP